MNNYSKNDIDNFNQKDKRISWLSIFSSLTQNPFDRKELVEIMMRAYELNDKLYENYPFVEQSEEGEKIISAEKAL